MMRENNYEIDLAIQRARSFADRFGDIEIDSYQGIPIFAAPGVHAMALDRLQSQLPAGARVLDLGAGAGAFSKRLSDAGYEVTACDLFDGNFAPQAALRFVTADLNGNFSTVAKGTWDAIVALELIEHLENPRHFLRECSKLLRSQGLVLLSTPNLSNPVSQALFLRTQEFQWYSETDYKAQGHITPLSPRTLGRCLAEMGFHVLWEGSVGNPFRQLWGRRNLGIRLIGAIMALLSGTPRVLQGEVYLGIWRKP